MKKDVCFFTNTILLVFPYVKTSSVRTKPDFYNCTKRIRIKAIHLTFYKSIIFNRTFNPFPPLSLFSLSPCLAYLSSFNLQEWCGRASPPNYRASCTSSRGLKPSRNLEIGCSRKPPAPVVFGLPSSLSNASNVINGLRSIHTAAAMASTFLRQKLHLYT